MRVLSTSTECLIDFDPGLYANSRERTVSRNSIASGPRPWNQDTKASRSNPAFELKFDDCFGTA